MGEYTFALYKFFNILIVNRLLNGKQVAYYLNDINEDIHRVAIPWSRFATWWNKVAFNISPCC